MAQLQVRNITPAFGAEVVGLDSGTELDDEDRQFLRNAFDNRGVLVFRDLDIDRDYQTDIADLLIGWEDRPTDTPPRNMLVSNKEPEGAAPFGRLLFHSDMMWAPEPFQVLSLYGVQVDSPAVPTVFASTTNAWDTLPEDLRSRIDGLHALHMTGQQRRGDGDDDLLEAVREQERSTTMPIEYRHPRTGRMMLYVSQMNTREIVELSSTQSEELLEALFAHLYAAENTCQHEWRNNDLVLWDNQLIQHARGNVTTEGPVRTLRKVISPIPSLDGMETPRFSNAS